MVRTEGGPNRSIAAAFIVPFSWVAGVFRFVRWRSIVFIDRCLLFPCEWVLNPPAEPKRGDTRQQEKPRVRQEDCAIMMAQRGPEKRAERAENANGNRKCD